MPAAAIHPMSEPAPFEMRAGTLLAALVALVGIDNLLVPRFLGIGGPLVYLGGAGAIAILCAAAYRAMPAAIPVRRLGWCLAVGIAVMLLGGEGRLLFATADWQVRDALIADLARAPWPFVYVGHGEPMLARFPLGMYLLPALAMRIGGQAAGDVALLAQNGAMLGIVLALGSLLGRDARHRRILLIVVLCFAGLDLFGNALFHPDKLLSPTSNMEEWGPTIFMSNIASAFWTPHHALSAWIGILLFLLWRSGHAPLAAFLSPLPLLAIWSPLGLMGVMPFAALAGIETLLRRRLRVADVALPALACLLALIPLVYLGADAAQVGFGVEGIQPAPYLLFEQIEVVPFLVVALFVTRGSRFGIATIVVTTACLALFPFVTIGKSVDFTMRAGAPAIVILSVFCADAVADGHGTLRRLMIVLLALGAVTPAHDVLRAMLFKPTPPPRCDFWQASSLQGFWYQGKETYLARFPRVPGVLRAPHPYPLPPKVADPCWAVPWWRARFGLVHHIFVNSSDTPKPPAL